MPYYTAKIKVISDLHPNGEWFTVKYNEETLERLQRSTSWVESVELFKQFTSKDDSIIQINLSCTMELKEEFQMLRMEQAGG